MNISMSIKTLWFNKRTEEQKQALKELAKIFSSENWSFIPHFEDVDFGTSIWFFNRFVKGDNAVEIVNTINNKINGVRAQYDFKEGDIEVIFD